MKTMRYGLPAIAALAALAILQSCLSSPDKKSGDKEVGANGHYHLFFEVPAASFHSDSTYIVRWTKSEPSVSDSVRLSLYRVDALVKTITGFPRPFGDTGYYSWRVGSAAAGDGYRIRITDAGDTSKWDYGVSFAIRSGYSGSVKVTSPQAGASLPPGQPLLISWTVTGSPGSSFYMQLYLGDRPIADLMASGSTGPGYATVSLPAGLARATTYRVRLRSDRDTSISAFSGFFTLQGDPPDAYEPDDSTSQAKTLVEGVWQTRSLTVGDADWIKVDAVQGRFYLVSTRSEWGQYLDVFDSSAAPAEAILYTYQSLFQARYSGTYLLKARLFRPGPYSAGISIFDSAQAGFPGTFTSPGPDSVWAAGSSHPLGWNVDTLLFRHHGRVELYRDARLMQVIAEDYSIQKSGSKDTGPYLWYLDPWLGSGSYRLKVVNQAFPLFKFQSPAFAITGLAPDAFEPDDSLPLAKNLPADTLQNRSLVQGDTDWVAFEAKADRSYAIGAYISGRQTRPDLGGGEYNLYMGGEVLDKDGKVLSSQTGPGVQFQFKAGYAGKYFLRFFQIKGSGGRYRIRLREYDSAMTESPLRFLAPDSAAAWRAGTVINLAWVPDSAMYGEMVKLDLHLEDGRKSILSNGSFTFATPSGRQSASGVAPNTGSFQWTSSTELTHSDRYRIKITNGYNPKISAFSAYFTLIAPEDDSLEPNNDRASATPIAPGRKWEKLSLTYGDHDWFRFQGVAGRIYTIRTVSPFPHSSLIKMDLTGVTDLLQATSKDTANYFPWYCPADGAYSFTVDVNGSWEIADYSLEFKEILPEDYLPTVTSPEAGISFSATSTAALPIAWNSKVHIAANMRLYLYNSKGEVGFIGSAPDTGSFPWKTRSGRLESGVKIAAGTDYYIRIISWLNKAFAGNSAVFTITP